MLQVVCTQPRRAAAAQVAQRVAEETNTQIGTTVGFCARFQDVLTPVRTKDEQMCAVSKLTGAMCSVSLSWEILGQLTSSTLAGGDPAQVHDRRSPAERAARRSSAHRVQRGSRG